MPRRLYSCLALITAILVAATAHAETRFGGLVSMQIARQQGLERMWTTALEMDGSRDRIVEAYLQVSPNPERERRIVEVLYDNRQEVYRDTDIDIYGDRLGKDGAVKRANQRVNELKARQVDAKTKEYNVPEIILYVTTERGFVQAIDSHSGATRWTARVGNPDYPTHGPAANDDYVAVTNGMMLYVLNYADGSIAWTKKVSYVPSASPALSEDLVYVATTRGAVESYNLFDPKRAAWVYQSRGHAMTRPICTSRSVAWPTDRGHMYVGEANASGILYRLEANGEIVAPASYADGKLFASSADGYVYCVAEVAGDILWRFSAGEPIHDSPIPIGDRVYVTTTGGGMYCISMQDGGEQWWSPRISKFVAASPTRLYARSSAGHLAILNPQSGGRLSEIPMSGVDYVYPNYLTDRIYVASRSGMVQCLRESTLEYPVEHQGDDVVKVSKPQVVQKGLGEQPADQPMPAAEQPDPFGPNPFAPAAPKPAAPAANPFGPDPFAPGGAAPSGDDADPFGASPF